MQAGTRTGRCGAVRGPWLQLALLLAAGCHARERTAETARRPPPPPSFVDAITFGDEASESAHELSAQLSEVVAGGLGLSARRLLPDGTTNWSGGRVAFRLRVDPARPNYATLRLWGSDRTENRLLLYCEGKQIGYRHLGDLDVLDEGNGAAALPGRFYYATTPLPTNLTAGMTSAVFEIRSNGRIWGYSTRFDVFQKSMTNATRGLYRFYTHTEGCFVPPPDEPQGAATANPPVRTAPGPEVLDGARERVAVEVRRALAQRGPLGQVYLWFVAQAYHVAGTPAHRNERAVAKVRESLDALYARYRANPDLARSEPSTWNPDWFGVGPAAQAVVLLADALHGSLDQEAPGFPGTTRRSGWAKMFRDCRDVHRANRRSYSNQSMIIDTYGIYLPNRALAVLQPAQALPEAQALRYLHEAAGLEPWLGSEHDGVPQRPLGDAYFLLTRKGLTKELGFVGYYGEVLDWLSAMYEATSPSPGRPGDPRLRQALIAAAKARARFRYPATDDDGFRAMRAETVIGWRDQAHYPGDVTYVQRPTWDGTPIGAAALTQDPTLAGAAQQMVDDHQFFASVAGQLGDGGFRGTMGLLRLPDQYATLQAVEPADVRLPMAPGEPDFAWADEEVGAVAIKDRGEFLYASLYWRARYAVNFLARVHHITPRFDRIAVVRQETEFEPSGQTYRRPDWTNWGFGNGGPRYSDGVRSAHAGEELPIAKIPDGIRFRPGDEQANAGRGLLYQLRFGDYFIAMNCSTGRTFEVAVPDAWRAGRELVSRKPVAGAAAWTLSPQSTIVVRSGTP
jgi:hypothetical protein